MTAAVRADQVAQSQHVAQSQQVAQWQHVAQWQRAATAWQTLAEQLHRVGGELADGSDDVGRAWPAGAAAGAARERVRAAHTAVDDAIGPVRRIAQALADHASGLATPGRSPDHVEQRTCATLQANLPPARPGWLAGASADPTGPVDRATVQAQVGRAPAEVHAWWAALTDAQRAWALIEHADLLGGLDGLPAVDRDRANREVLDTRLTRLQAQEADLAGRLDHARRWLPWTAGAVGSIEIELAKVRNELSGLQAVRSSLAGRADALLLGLASGASADDGRAIVALGDPDQARHTAVFVPGAGTDLTDTPGEVARAALIRAEADPLTPADHDVSVIYWLGYDSPLPVDSLSYDEAQAGARPLARFFEGLQVTGASHLTVVAHSYGSTVVAEAALHAGLSVDDIIAAGSPGMHTDHAADLGLDPRHVWAGVADDDPIGGALGVFGHGREPTDPAFGGNRFVVDTHGHGGYWDPGSASLHNQAAIIMGRYDQVSLVDGASPTPLP